MVTASAIGIDYIYQSSTLPLSSGVSRKFRIANEKGTLPFDLKLTEDKKGQRLLNKIFPARSIAPQHPVLDEKGNPVEKEVFNFGNEKDNIPSLNVNYALRSGENGLFSLDKRIFSLPQYEDCLSRGIGSRISLQCILRRRSTKTAWFDKHGICYYTQTDNSSLVFALLNNRQRV